jgi:hypothetical protein
VKKLYVGQNREKPNGGDKTRQVVVGNTLNLLSGYKFGSGVVSIGVPSQCGGHGNGLGRGVGVGLQTAVWIGIIAAMLAAMNKNMQRIIRDREGMNIPVGGLVFIETACRKTL